MIAAFDGRPIDMERGSPIEGRKGQILSHMTRIRIRGDAWSEVFPWRESDAIVLLQCKKCYEFNFAICQCSRK